MDEVKLMNRTDTKFLLTKNELATVLETIVDDYRILEVNSNRISSYRSLYYDTPGNKLYYDHHNGRLDRHKVRYREYIDSKLCFLEVKHKYKGRTNKQRIQRERIEETMQADSKQFLVDTNQLNDELVPSLWNGFNRATLVNKNAPERMTIDFDLTYEWGDWSHKEENLIIVELKQERVDRNSPFMKASKAMGIRPFSISKYCIGMVMKDRQLKYNNFKPKILAIEKIRNGSIN